MRRRSAPLGLALVAYVVALVQRPGDVIADTKVDLYVDPARFLSNVLSVWSPTTDLGHVFAAQYSGYAWPMAPWFAAGDALGAPTWLVHRLWLGTVLALAGWGVVRLLDALASPRRGALHVAAGFLYVINPYVAVYANRTSISLLSYAALPWLLLAVHRGLREPRGWRWPAVFALVLGSTGGGVNVAVTAWLLVGPLLLLVYERRWGGVPRGAVRPYLMRSVGVNAVAQLWWVVPVLIQGLAAPSFLPFSEQPGTIWSTTSLTESLRLMGFWTSYVGVGFGGTLRAFQGSAPAMLFLLPVVLAGLLVPALALAAFPVTRRWRYAPFFVLLTFAGLLIMAAGWPEGTPLRRVATGAYYRVQSIDVLRTTYKAGALTALGIAVLGGAAFAAAWERAIRRAWFRPALALGAIALTALAAWPLVTGRAVERQLAFRVPAAYRAVAADLDRRGGGTRAYALPAQEFAYARWGGTIDPILPSLTSHPVTTHWIVPFADWRSADLQFAVDGLITQERLVPGQLRPLLDLLGVGDVVVAADGDRGRGGEAPAADVERLLRGPGGLPPGRAYGAAVTALPGAGQLEPPLRVPRVQRTQLPTGGLVRLVPRGPLTVVDGGAGGLAAMAAFGLLDPRAPLAYAPDVGAPAIRRAAAAGGTIVVSDTNRRRAFVASRPRGQQGPTLTATEAVSADGAMLDPWQGDTRAETVQQLAGVRSVTAPASPQVTQLPDRRPFAAIDGDLSTAWIADRMLDPARHRLTVAFDRPRDVRWISVYPYSDSRAVVRAVRVGDRRFAVHHGWNRLAVRLRHVGSVTVAIAKVDKPRHAPAGAGGLRELRIPGVHARETLRPPVVAEDALRGADVDAARLVYLLDRTTKDVPRLAQRYVGERGAGLLRDAQDPERRLVREIDPPASRRYAVRAWGSVDPRLPDDAIDRLVAGPRARGGATGAGTATSSSRYEGLGRLRASGAFDRGARAWIGEWIAGRPAWIGWRTARPTSVRALRLRPPHVVVRRPTRVRLVVDGRPGPALAVGPGGRVRLPGAVRGRAFRLDVLAARFPPRTPGAVRQRRAVGIGEVEGTGMPGLRAPAGGAVRLPCGAASLAVAGRTVALGGRVARSTLVSGAPLRLRGCGAPVDVPAGTVRVVGGTAPVRVDRVALVSGAPAGAAVAVGRVIDPGRQQGSTRDGVRVAVDRPAWLVLGESYDRFWRASCDGRDLGAPAPMQGYANGWRVDRGCRAVRFWYAPQRAADVGAIISLAACAALLGVALAGFGRRRRRGDRDTREAATTVAHLPQPRTPARLTLSRALMVAALVAAPLGLAFGLRAGVVALPALAVVLWRGVADRALGALAGVLLAGAVPAIYVVVALTSRHHRVGGNSTEYALDRVAAHWVALAALVAVGVVLVRTLAQLRAAERRADVQP